MTLAVLFCVIMIVGLVLNIWLDYVLGQPYLFARASRTVLFFILLSILGLAQFGRPIK